MFKDTYNKLKTQVDNLELEKKKSAIGTGVGSAGFIAGTAILVVLLYKAKIWEAKDKDTALNILKDLLTKNPLFIVGIIMAAVGAAVLLAGIAGLIMNSREASKNRAPLNEEEPKVEGDTSQQTSSSASFMSLHDDSVTVDDSAITSNITDTEDENDVKQESKWSRISGKKTKAAAIAGGTSFIAGALAVVGLLHKAGFFNARNTAEQLNILKGLLKNPLFITALVAVGAGIVALLGASVGAIVNKYQHSQSTLAAPGPKKDSNTPEKQQHRDDQPGDSTIQMNSREDKSGKHSLPKQSLASTGIITGRERSNSFTASSTKERDDFQTGSILDRRQSKKATKGVTFVSTSASSSGSSGASTPDESFSQDFTFENSVKLPLTQNATDTLGNTLQGRPQTTSSSTPMPQPTTGTLPFITDSSTGGSVTPTPATDLIQSAARHNRALDVTISISSQAPAKETEEVVTALTSAAPLEGIIMHIPKVAENSSYRGLKANDNENRELRADSISTPDLSEDENIVDNNSPPPAQLNGVGISSNSGGSSRRASVTSWSTPPPATGKSLIDGAPSHSGTSFVSQESGSYHATKGNESSGLTSPSFESIDLSALQTNREEVVISLPGGPDPVHKPKESLLPATSSADNEPAHTAASPTPRSASPALTVLNMTPSTGALLPVGTLQKASTPPATPGSNKEDYPTLKQRFAKGLKNFFSGSSEDKEPSLPAVSNPSSSLAGTTPASSGSASPTDPTGSQSPAKQTTPVAQEVDLGRGGQATQGSTQPPKTAVTGSAATPGSGQQQEH